MRIVFWLLLLANLLLYVWAQGYLGVQESGREPERMTRQLNPEKLQIVQVVATADAIAKTAAADTPVPICKRLEGLSADEAKSLTDAVHVRGGWETQTLPLPATPMQWVAIVDLPGMAQAEKKKAELRQLGVTESTIVSGTTPGTFAVSLGLFREPPRAQEFLQSLTAKGVRSARIVPRNAARDKFAVELRAAADQLASTLPGLSAALPGSTVQDCTP